MQTDPTTSLSEYLAALQGALQPPTRSAASLPSSSDISFHRSIDKGVAQSLDNEHKKLQSLISSVTSWAERGSASKGKKRATNQHEEDDSDDDGEKDRRVFARVAEVVDDLLEKADICMDEYTGKLAPRKLLDQSKEPSSSNGTLTHGAPTAQPVSKTGRLPPQLLNAQIDPPQRKFSAKPNNSSEESWDRPLTMGKPHALVPLDWKAPPPGPGEPVFEPGVTRQGMYCAEGDPRHNPYYYEIFNSTIPTFVYQPPSEEERQAPPQLDAEVPFGVAGVPFKWIDSAADLDELATHLSEDRVREIAIDLEAHAYRSYQGIACLMQLSTRWGDYILDLLSDTIRQGAEKLNTAFADPEKIKILHGAEHDVLWLQRDCGLYLVNLFDTYHATNVLGFPGHGLAYLLSRYYDFEADKRYQLADWRIRPLPKEMLYYARSDTHSLIYVYHCLRWELLTTGGKQAMDEVFKRSKITAARRYAKEIWDEEGNTREGWRSLWRRMGSEEARGTDLRMDVKQMGRTERLVRRLHRWRDEVAREEDESPRYILSAANLINLASRAPMTKSEAMAFFTPGIQPLRKRASQVANVIKMEVLAWEQDQKEASDSRKAELAKQSNGLMEAQPMQEDLGSVALESPLVTKAAPRPALTTSNTSAALWESDTNGAARPLLRSKNSSLFGDTSIAASQGSEVQAVSPSQAAAQVHASILSDLHTLIGPTSSMLLGLGPSQSREDSSAEVASGQPGTGNVASDVVESYTSLRRDADGQWTAAGDTESAHGTGHNGTTQEDEEANEQTIADIDSDADSGSEASEGGAVQVKKSKKKKAKWSKAEKRKAREERERAQGGIPAPTNEAEEISSDKGRAKKRRTEGEDTASGRVIKPFDYSTTTSILDAPRPPRPMAPAKTSAGVGVGAAAGAGAGGPRGNDKDKTQASSKSKGKKADKGAKAAKSGPERFADMRQPKDRTSLAANVGKSMTFR
ncbi:unnamed protein product [Parajaminaea phylloscopi]